MRSIAKFIAAIAASTVVLVVGRQFFQTVLALAILIVIPMKAVSKVISLVVLSLTSMLSYAFKFFYDAEVMYSIPSEHQDLVIEVDNRDMMVPAPSDPAERNFEDSEMTTINRRRP